jgi:hypothetical protein
MKGLNELDVTLGVCSKAGYFTPVINFKFKSNFPTVSLEMFVRNFLSRSMIVVLFGASK